MPWVGFNFKIIDNDNEEGLLHVSLPSKNLRFSTQTFINKRKLLGLTQYTFSGHKFCINFITCSKGTMSSSKTDWKSPPGALKLISSLGWSLKLSSIINEPQE